MNNPLERVELLVGKEKIEILRGSTVLIVGIGGVGSYAAESLARSGIGRLILIDNDSVSLSNLNRQLLATFDTIGKYKTNSMKDRIETYASNCEVICMNSFFDSSLENIFEQKIDYVIDAIDTVTSKMDLIDCCHKYKIPCISSLGMANRFDSSKVIETTLDKTSYDPLAKALRDLAKKRGITYKIHVTFSTEIPLKQNVEVNSNGKTRKERIPPASMVFVPAASGILCASIVVRNLMFKK